MASAFLKNIKISLFGESHGEAIGVVLDGIAPGIKIDFDFINQELSKRRAKDNLSTPRREKDEFKVLSGVYNGYTTGTPITFVIENKDTNSNSYKDFDKTPRPSHADYTANLKYFGFSDFRGGGHFSGRITAPIVIVGAICKQILKSKGVEIVSHLKNINGIIDDNIDINNYQKLLSMDFPVVNDDIMEKMKTRILDARSNSDSVGGVVETVVLGCASGIGEPFFDSLESEIASLVFSVPAVKGVSFGKGFEFAEMLGSEANDAFYYDNGQVKTRTNNNGGINGGISNGMPIVINTVIKPTPSISKRQETVDLANKCNTMISIAGRHDPCIVQRAYVVIESMIAIALVNLYVERFGYLWMK